MIIISQERNSGKTTKLIKLANSSNGIIICSTISEKKSIKMMSNSLKLETNVMTVNEFKKCTKDYSQTKVYIDNLDRVLFQLLYVNIDYSTITPM